MGSNLNDTLLKYINEHDNVDSLMLANEFKEDHQKIVGVIKSLQALGDVIEVTPNSRKTWELTEEGKSISEHGSHEFLVYKAVPEMGIIQSELIKLIPNGKVGFSKAMAKGWIALDKITGKVTRKIDTVEDEIQQHLNCMLNNDADRVPENLKQDYKKRKLAVEVTTKSYIIKKGKLYTTSISKPETDLTPEIILTESWKNKTFKLYNFNALGVPPVCGHLHPLLKVRTEFHNIFLEMGFTEMPTNNFIESSFWNFDALFQPQQHPARDAHDTFYLSDPSESYCFPKDYMECVKTVHSKGGYGSQGYCYEWSFYEAQKNLLRTHTTAVSARILYQLAQQKIFRPVKYFSIDRVFRNETLDATHLAEFHQVEGIIADYDLTLGDLIGVLHQFFRKLGITKLNFKPAYNPYTEPSMEIFCYHDGLEKWIEVGNSGIFRPEMLLPMGLPDKVNVIAWGLSLERPTMIKYGYNNIRDLVGPKVNLQMVSDNGICRLDK